MQIRAVRSSPWRNTGYKKRPDCSGRLRVSARDVWLSSFRHVVHAFAVLQLRAVPLSSLSAQVFPLPEQASSLAGIWYRCPSQRSGLFQGLNCLPDNMKSDIKKAGNCKKLTGLICTPTCNAGYTFVMDGEEYRKCKNTAFFHSLTAENMEHILKLIKAEIEV